MTCRPRVQVEMIMLNAVTLFESYRFVRPSQAVVLWVKCRLVGKWKLSQKDVLLVIAADSYFSVNGF